MSFAKSSFFAKDYGMPDIKCINTQALKENTFPSWDKTLQPLTKKGD